MIAEKVLETIKQVKDGTCMSFHLFTYSSLILTLIYFSIGRLGSPPAGMIVIKHNFKIMPFLYL